jgi:hypothetical protein
MTMALSDEASTVAENARISALVYIRPKQPQIPDPAHSEHGAGQLNNRNQKSGAAA